MATDLRDVLEVLKAELEFLKNGGYHPAARDAWRPQLMFQDSPTCLNFDSAQPRKPCSECILMRFVPLDLRNKRIPCRYIPLGEQGETAAFFYSYGTQEELETVAERWLTTTIARMERGHAKGPTDTNHIEVHVPAKFVRGC